MVKEYICFRCSTSSRKGIAACKGQIIKGELLEKILVDSIIRLSENKPFLSEEEKLLQKLREGAKPVDKDFEKEKRQLLKEEKEISARKDTLIEKLERTIIGDETFLERFNKIIGELEDRSNTKAGIDLRFEESNVKSLSWKHLIRNL